MRGVPRVPLSHLPKPPYIEPQESALCFLHALNNGLQYRAVTYAWFHSLIHLTPRDRFEADQQGFRADEMATALSAGSNGALTLRAGQPHYGASHGSSWEDTLNAQSPNARAADFMLLLHDSHVTCAARLTLEPDVGPAWYLLDSLHSGCVARLADARVATSFNAGKRSLTHNPHRPPVSRGPATRHSRRRHAPVCGRLPTLPHTIHPR